MTEAEWLACTDPSEMLNLLKTETHLRKWRLLGVAIIRTDLPWLHLGSRTLTQEEWESTRPILEAIEACADSKGTAITQATPELDFHHALDVSEMLHSTGANEQAIEARIIRDIFGNPFRPATFSPAWQTDTAVAIAKQMYEAREFSAMPILADALQDAGCDNTDILDHCRDTSLTHVRGCWVVDLVLGKS